MLGYILALLVVGGVLFLAASFAFGRDEEMAPALPEGTPAELPDDRPATGADLRALRLAVVLRGYRMEEVDWVLDRLAEQVDARDREIARLRSVLHVEPVPADGEPELLSHPFPAVRHVEVDRPEPDRGPRPVPEGTEVTDARPDRPARDIRTTAPDGRAARRPAGPGSAG